MSFTFTFLLLIVNFKGHNFRVGVLTVRDVRKIKRREVMGQSFVCIIQLMHDMNEYDNDIAYLTGTPNFGISLKLFFFFFLGIVNKDKN